jgi:PAS domain S-box-containing protein
MQKKILIIDSDNKYTPDLIQDLESFGYECVEKNTEKEFFNYLENDLTDLIIINTEFNDVDGVELLTKIKSHPVYYDIPVVMMTENVDDNVLENCFGFGCDNFIMLPPEKYTLRTSIKTVFEKLGFVRKIQLQRDELKMQRNIAIEKGRELQRSERRLNGLINTSMAGIAMSDINSSFIFTNSVYPLLFGYTYEEILKMTHFQLVPLKDLEEVRNHYKMLLSGELENLDFIRQYLRKDGTLFWGHISVSVIRNEKGKPESIVSYLADIDSFKKREVQISLANQNIQAAMTYAKRIQDALLPSKKLISELFPENFILYKPKEIVSGDFYWAKKVDEYYLIAAGDCTGHGVPGAFMSLLFTSMLNEIGSRKKISQANRILEELKNSLQNILNKSSANKIIQDGMDIALCIYNSETNVLQYAGAFNPLYMFRNNELKEYKADSMPIGFWRGDVMFTNYEIQPKEDDIFYIFSDGYFDQTGGEKSRKFMKGNFRNLLQSIHLKTFAEQENILSETIKNWIGNTEQVDDILVIGFKCKPAAKEIQTDRFWGAYTILIADDEANNFKLLEEILRNSKVKLIWAKNGAEAVEICKINQNIDLVLMDILMPVTDGIQAMKQIREFDKKIPIIVQTALSESNTKTKSFEAGCDDYVSKPINRKELLATIAKFLR